MLRRLGGSVLASGFAAQRMPLSTKGADAKTNTRDIAAVLAAMGSEAIQTVQKRSRLAPENKRKVVRATKKRRAAKLATPAKLKKTPGPENQPEAEAEAVRSTSANKRRASKTQKKRNKRLRGVTSSTQEPGASASVVTKSTPAAGRAGSKQKKSMVKKRKTSKNTPAQDTRVKASATTTTTTATTAPAPKKRRQHRAKQALATPPVSFVAAPSSPMVADADAKPAAVAAVDDTTREREVAMLRAEEVILRGMIRDARGALHEAKRRDRDIMLLAREPWRVVTGGPPLRFTASALKRDVAAAIKAIPKGPGRVEVTRRVGKIVPSEWKAAAKMNAAIRTKLVTTLAVDSVEKPDPFLLERLKAQPWFTGERIVRDAAAGVDRLKEAAKHGGKNAGHARRSEASQRLRREWFAMNEAIANHGHAGSAAARELMSLTDYVGGLGDSPAGGKGS